MTWLALVAAGWVCGAALAWAFVAGAARRPFPEPFRALPFDSLYLLAVMA